MPKIFVQIWIHSMLLLLFKQVTSFQLMPVQIIYPLFCLFFFLVTYSKNIPSFSIPGVFNTLNIYWKKSKDNGVKYDEY